MCTSRISNDCGVSSGGTGGGGDDDDDLARRTQRTSSANVADVATPLTDRYAANRPRLFPSEAASGLLSIIDRLTPADTGSFHDVRGQAVEW